VLRPRRAIDASHLTPDSFSQRAGDGKGRVAERPDSFLARSMTVGSMLGVYHTASEGTLDCGWTIHLPLLSMIPVLYAFASPPRDLGAVVFLFDRTSRERFTPSFLAMAKTASRLEVVSNRQRVDEEAAQKCQISAVQKGSNTHDQRLAGVWS
jgi:hypothetical protein